MKEIKENLQNKLKDIQNEKKKYQEYFKELEEKAKIVEANIYTLQGAEKLIIQLINEIEQEDDVSNISDMEGDDDNEND